MLKKEILKLREEGKSYNEIQKLLNCSKGTISYYCSEGQKEKTLERTRKRRENKILSKTEKFKYRKPKRYLQESVRKFNKRDNNILKKVNKEIEPSFTWEDVLEKYGEETFCYLSGIPLNLYSNECQFDHIIPTSRGGNNTIDNLGICHKDVNYMKGDMTNEELINWCKIILEYNGYEVNKN